MADIIDAGFVLPFVASASTGNTGFAAVVAIVGVAQHVLRKSEWLEEIITGERGIDRTSLPLYKKLLLPPNAIDVSTSQDTNWQDVFKNIDKQPVSYKSVKEQGSEAVQETVEDVPRLTQVEATARLPKLVRYGAKAPSVTSVPLGIDAISGSMQWIDFAKDTLHLGLYGQSGSGKDNLLRVWFRYLTNANNPDAIQFAILDGKGDYLLDNLAHLDHMFISPAGGLGDEGKQSILDGITAVHNEASRRQKLIRDSNSRTREEYIRKTGDNLPLLFLWCTDVGDDVAGDVEKLLISLVSKARAFGIRIVVSMQNPSGESTKWRSNLSTVIASNLQMGSQDTPALGIEVKDMLYRPSKLPVPSTRQGIFVVRRANDQLLVQAPYLPEEEFDRYVETLPVKDNPQSVTRKNAKNECLAPNQRIAERSGLRIDERITHQEVEFDLLAFIVSETDKTRDSIVKSLLKNGYTYKQVRDELSKCKPSMSIGNDRIKELNQELKAESENE